MDLTLVERLVCPMAHPITPLVVRADASRNGRLIRGIVGCPECMNEWPITDGVVQFGPSATFEATECPDAPTIAALLGLTEPGLVITDGVSTSVIAALTDAYGALVVAMDGADVHSPATVINGAERVPVATGAARGLAMFRPERSPAFVESAVRALAKDGRALASVSLVTGAGLREIARDATTWIAVRDAPPVPVQLRRGP